MKFVRTVVAAVVGFILFLAIFTLIPGLAESAFFVIGIFLLYCTAVAVVRHWEEVKDRFSGRGRSGGSSFSNTMQRMEKNAQLRMNYPKFLTVVIAVMN